MKIPGSDSSGPDWVPTILWGIFDARGAGSGAGHPNSAPFRTHRAQFEQ
jgi:hypothetical protein